MGRVHSGGVGSILLHTGGAQWGEQPITWGRIKNIELHRGPPHPPRSPHYGKPGSVQFSFLDTFFYKSQYVLFEDGCSKLLLDCEAKMGQSTQEWTNWNLWQTTSKKFYLVHSLILWPKYSVYSDPFQVNVPILCSLKTFLVFWCF